MALVLSAFGDATNTTATPVTTHTPTPMAFLNQLLKRPKNEPATLLMPVGYPAQGARVPVLERKPLDRLVQWNQG